MEEFELYVLNEKFESLFLVDAYESMIWTDRYKECGDFELYLPASSNILVYAKHGNYLWTKGSDRLMIIEQTEITTDVENGNHLKITGRSLESLLDRRIIWNEITLSGNIQTVIKRLITDAIISPSLEARRINNFIFVDSTDPEILTSEMEEAQYLGDNLYDVIVDICSVFDVGFKVIYNWDTGNFEFSLYSGTNRSYSQSIVPWVVFSPEFDNIITSDFMENSVPYRNVNLVAGEEPEDPKNYSDDELYHAGEVVIHNGDSSSDVDTYYKCITEITTPEEWDETKWQLLSGKPPSIRKFVYVDKGSTFSGLKRREMFTDGSSKKQEYTDENDNKVKLTDAQYISVLKEFGLSELYLDEHALKKTFDGEMNVQRGYKYGIDFQLGDIVQMENEYGLGSEARVTDLIISQDTNGIQMYPQFKSMSAE